jgi:hypothetical protein
MLATLAAALVAVPAASAHVVKASGPYRLEIGWGDEPPLAGSGNFVQAAVADASGSAVEVPAGALSAEVSYGADATTIPLVPTEAPGELRGELVPTRPGAYAFEITGAIAGHTVDVRAACGEATFDCVESGAGAEFPVNDPSNGELALRLESEAGRAKDAGERADDARTLAIAALALAALALAGAAALALRGRHGSGHS